MTAYVISNAGGNWNAAASYVANSGFPVAGDTVTATATSGNLTVNVASACASIILTNYVGTLTFNANLTLTSTCTFVAGMTIAGTAGTLIGTGTATFTSGGLTMTGGLTLQGTATFTMGDNWTVNGLTSAGSGALTTTINSNQINCAGGLHGVGATSTITGTTLFNVTGGTWDSAQGSGTNGFNVNVTLAGNVTVSGDLRYGGSKTLTYASGTISGASSPRLLIAGGGAAKAYTITGFSGSTGATGQWPGGIVFSASATTVTLGSNLNMSGLLSGNTQGITFAGGAFNITCGTFSLLTSSTATNTLTGTLTCTGLMLISNTSTQTWVGNFAVLADSLTIDNGATMSPASGQSWTVTNALSITGAAAVWNAVGGSTLNIGGLTTTFQLTGTQLIRFGGTGTWQGASSCNNSVTIDTAGTLTLSGTVLYAQSGTPTLTYTAGTVTAGTSIFSIFGSCTLATNGMSFANVKISAAATVTLSSLLTATGTFTWPDAAATLAGAGDATVATMTNTGVSAARTYTLDSGNTYTITTAFTPTGGPSSHVTFAGSSVAGTKANLVLNVGASQLVVYTDATDIDSSAGQTINTLSGTLLRTVNWATAAIVAGGLRAIGNAG